MHTFAELKRRVAREQAGFSLIELLIAILVMAIGIFALISTFDGSRKLSNTAERVLAASAAGERQMEQLSARMNTVPASTAALYDRLGTTAALTNLGTDQVRQYVCPANAVGEQVTFRWNFTACPGSAPHGDEQVVVTAANGGVANTETWFDARTGARGNIYTIITWVDEDCANTIRTAGAGCAGRDYKRITVAVTVNNGPPKRPVILSTIAFHPAQSPQGGSNPYTQPELVY